MTESRRAPIAQALADRYEIEHELGAGGMATVYLAQDLKHRRKVAVKVLRPELAAVLGAERFLKEIETTANLQHPHILPLFDSGEAGGFLYYVMPYVEGETLRDKVSRETQLGVDDAVRITTDVADALDYAHRHDVIHRDIKPENILLHDGRPMVADFGIALAVSAAAGGRMTETGLSLGTPHYMSPEQATADMDLTNRSDIYSLGCVLYEMLTGDPPHTGSSAQQIVMKIVTDEARPVNELRKSVPPHVAAATAKSLEKLAADRFGTAKEFAEALTNTSFTLPAPGVPVGAGTPATGPWNGLSVGATALAAILLVTTLWGWLRPAAERLERFVLTFPQEQGTNWSQGFAILPDGSGLVYGRTTAEGELVLALRRWRDLQSTDIRGTAGGSAPSVSPDGASVVFMRSVRGELVMVPLSGGTARVLTTAVNCCPSWASDDWIYFTDPNGGVSRVNATDGQVESVTQLAAGEDIHIPRMLLPAGDALVFTAFRVGAGEISVVTVTSGERTPLTTGVHAEFAPSGHLVITLVDGTVVAAPFDPRRRELTGPATPVLDETVFIPLSPTATQHRLSASSGTFVYRRGGTLGYSPVWVERDGSSEEIDPGWGVVEGPAALGVALSPDQSRLAVASEGHLWIKRIGTGAMSRITPAAGVNGRPRWTVDGRSVTFISDRTGDPALWQRRADGTGDARLLLEHERPIWEGMYTPDGSSLVYRFGIQGSSRDIYMMPADGTGEGVPLLATDAQERSPAISPDGRWLAYQSNETGRDEIYVRPFPNVGDGHWVISSSGGTGPLWAHSGRELFYRDGLGNFIAVDVTTDPAFSAGQQRVLFSAHQYAFFIDHALYDITPDDQRFVMLRRNEGDVGFVLVRNWFEELKARVGN